MFAKICVVSTNKNIQKKIKDEVSFSAFSVNFLEVIEQVYSFTYDGIVDLILYDVCEDTYDKLDSLRVIKQDPLFYATAVVIILPCNDVNQILKIVKDYPVDDYICLGNFDFEYLLKIKMATERVRRSVTVNPLTKLPSGMTIQNEVQTRIDNKQTFAFAYTDLDNFKSYNDTYGFAKGDEIIKLLGRIILNIVRIEQPRGSFVGHIGGDDFVFIVDPDKVETVVKKMNQIFSEMVPSFYNKIHAQQGYIETTDRQGNLKKFPLMKLSTAVVISDGRYNHYSQIIDEASAIKTYIKQNGLLFLINRRKG